MSPPVRVDRRGEVVIATIDVPERHNAADLDVYHRLEAALAIEARGYVITGANGDFSAGDDVRMFGFDGLESSDRFIVEVTQLFQQIEATPRPVVAAVDGYALGFGFELALACDLVVATPRAVLGLPEITHGAAPPNAMGRGPAVVGRGLVRHLALAGRQWLTGEEAHAYGMVAELHESEAVLGEAVLLVDEMARTDGFLPAKRYQTADAEATYRMAPVVMGPLMASDTVAASQRRYAGG